MTAGLGGRIFVLVGNMGNIAPQDFSGEVGPLFINLSAALDDQSAFDKETRSILEASIDQSESLIASLRSIESYRGWGVAYGVTFSRLKKAVPEDLRSLFFDSAGRIIRDELAAHAIETEAVAKQRLYRKLGHTMGVTHPEPVRIDYIFDVEEDEDTPEIGEPIQPLRFEDRLILQSKQIKSRFIELAANSEDNVIELAKATYMELHQGLTSEDLDRVEDMIEEARHYNLERAFAICDEFEGLIRIKVLEVFNVYVMHSVQRLVGTQQNYQKAKAVIDEFDSSPTKDIMDLLDSFVLRDAGRLIAQGREGEALELITTIASEGSQQQMLMVLSPNAAQIARQAVEQDEAWRARQVVEAFFPNSVQKGQMYKELNIGGID